MSAVLGPGISQKGNARTSARLPRSRKCLAYLRRQVRSESVAKPQLLSTLAPKLTCIACVALDILLRGRLFLDVQASGANAVRLARCFSRLVLVFA